MRSDNNWWDEVPLQEHRGDSDQMGLQDDEEFLKWEQLQYLELCAGLGLKNTFSPVFFVRILLRWGSRHCQLPMRLASSRCTPILYPRSRSEASMPQRPTHCNKDVAATIVYEMAMFEFIGKKILTTPELVALLQPGKPMYVGTGGSDEDISALVESLLVHTRVLFHFFCRDHKPGGHPDDVFATDFIAGWNANSSKSQCPYLVQHAKRLDKALAHLSIERAAYARIGKGWEIKTIYDEIDPLIAAFKASLGGTEKPWFA